MPRVELGSEKKTIKTSTFLVFSCKFHNSPFERLTGQIAILIYFHPGRSEDIRDYLI